MLTGPDAMPSDAGAGRVRLGILTPSSNTVLEPLTVAMLAGLPQVSAHFSRFRVTQISLSDSALGQFGTDAILQAADLLADARVNAIVWSGTSAAWLGFERDEYLCEAITAATGIPAGTAVLEFRDLFEARSHRRIGLVTPYRRDVQQRIAANWQASGFECCAERHLDLETNFAFADVDEHTIADMSREVAREGCDAVAIVCTNLRGAALAPRLECELGRPVYDSVAVALRAGLRLAGVAPGHVTGWGSVFEMAPL